MYYELQKSKRGKKCNVCGSFINKDEFYFSTTEYNSQFPYPIKKSICMKCCKEITNPDFVARLKNLLALCSNIETKVNSLSKQQKEEPIF